LYALGYNIFSGAFNNALVSWAISKTSPSLVSSSWPVQVLAAAIISYVVLGTEMDLSDYIGSSTIIIGLLLVCWAKYKEEKELKEEKIGSLLIINDDSSSQK
jgi:drug/metabolite transporter (DMT)-like permease